MKNTTAIIINFLREPYLFEAIRSLKDKYPNMPILVGENGEYTKDKKKAIEAFKNVKYYKIGFDAGVCVARNKLIKKVKTKYVLVGDDDFQYNDLSNIKAMEKFLDVNPNFDLIAGRIIEGGQVKNYQGFIHQYGDHFKYEALTLDNYNKCEQTGLNYKACDLAFNFFVARTDALVDTLWEEKIKVAYEHSTFFIDFVNNGYKVAFTPDVFVVHKPNLSVKLVEQDIYKQFRNRKNDKKVFFERFKIGSVVDMNGRTDTYDASSISEVTFCITMFSRWDKLKNLLHSITEYYPTAKILIADQSKKFYAKNYRALYEELMAKGLKNKPMAYNLPYDCGLSACRNKLVALAKTDYVLILEEDFVFTPDTNIKVMLDYLEENTNYQGVGGQVAENDILLKFSHYYKKRGKSIIMEANENEFKDGFRDTEGILNFAIFRRNLFNTIQWDNDIKIEGEHTDFLLKLKGAKVKIAECNLSTVTHDKSRDSGDYKILRQRGDFLKILFNIYKINKLIYPSGYTIYLDGDIIKKGKGL